MTDDLIPLILQTIAWGCFWLAFGGIAVYFLISCVDYFTGGEDV